MNKELQEVVSAQIKSHLEAIAELTKQNGISLINMYTTEDGSYSAFTIDVDGTIFDLDTGLKEEDKQCYQ